MKAQTEIIAFVLIFMVSVVLIFSAIMWGKPLFEKNIDASSLASAEQFMKELDRKIQSIASKGGKERMDFNLKGTLKLIEGKETVPDDVIEFEASTNLKLPEKWILLNTANESKIGKATDTSSVIREIKLGDVLKIQLFYRLRENYVIDLYSEGNAITSTGVTIEKISDSVEKIEGKDVFVPKVKLVFE